ncbi:hypothetical protein PTQ19_10385 [Microbacterium esteraromaticum]|uniref:hypothetical protein n=1 Tax=Microbacterium esteraromaticum TaxID=57043 RepID=UPI0023685B9B|nr:hypothetical protein [Microbacterium esteraromaticum]WDH77929.1 hypothetical protein PTQ19_10385 [Microbacterium esteraromaticum]
MRRLPKRMMPHGGLVSYRAKLGEGTYGPQHDDVEVVPKRAAIDDKRKLIRTADGRELMSQSRIALDLEHLMPVGSLVTIWRGRANERETTALVVAVADWPGLPQFVEIALE